MCLVCLLVVGLVSEASAQSFYSWYQDGYTWRPGPNGKEVGSCYGNCGAGCSDRNDGNCIPQRYNDRMGWDLQYLTDIVVVNEGQTTECVPEGDSLPRIYEVTWQEVEVLGRYTYHGWVAPGCKYHDSVCPEMWGIGCAFFMGCGSPAGFRDWAYDKWLHAYTESRYAIGWGSYGQC